MAEQFGKQVGYNEKVDIFAFGATLFFLAFGQHAFLGGKSLNIRRNDTISLLLPFSVEGINRRRSDDARPRLDEDDGRDVPRLKALIGR